MDREWLRGDESFSQNLASGALSYSTVIARQSRLDHVYFKATVGITETGTITLVSALGSTYDVVLYSRTLSSQQSFSFRPQSKILLQAGDSIKVECTDANGTGTVSGAVKMSEL